MRIGIFDSGLGGLLITDSLTQHLPQYDYLYLGDTARVPYGNRSQETIFRFTLQAVEYLFRQNCQLIILACNTASAEALRRIQQEYLPAHYPERRVLGVLIPAAEEATARSRSGRIGVLATQGTVHSNAYPREIVKRNPAAQVFQQAAPLLVPLIEHNGQRWAKPIVESYLQPLLEQSIDTLILGCTHYPALKDTITEAAGTEIAIISQDEFIPTKLAAYLQRHPEIDNQLSQGNSREYQVTDQVTGYEQWTGTVGQTIKLDLVRLGTDLLPH